MGFFISLNILQLKSDKVKYIAITGTFVRALLITNQKLNEFLTPIGLNRRGCIDIYKADTHSEIFFRKIF